MTRFLYPPRPEQAVAASLIPYYQSHGFKAQTKKNGTCEVISVDSSGLVEFRTRHGEPNRAWKPTSELVGLFSNFKNSVFVGELLHSKHPSVKNKIYLFDLLRLDGKDLVGSTTADRLRLLQKTVPTTDSLEVASWIKGDVLKFYNDLTSPLDEGIVLKNPLAKLSPCLTPKSNSESQVKVRRTTKNFSF